MQGNVSKESNRCKEDLFVKILFRKYSVLIRMETRKLKGTQTFTSPSKKLFPHEADL